MSAYLRQSYKRWMPNLRHTHSQISQSEAFLCLGLFDKTNFTSSYIVPENGLLICTSKLQVFIDIYKQNLRVPCNDLQVNLWFKFTSAFKCLYKCI
jgi:hypothetical protein